MKIILNFTLIFLTNAWFRNIKCEMIENVHKFKCTNMFMKRRKKRNIVFDVKSQDRIEIIMCAISVIRNSLLYRLMMGKNVFIVGGLKKSELKV